MTLKFDLNSNKSKASIVAQLVVVEVDVNTVPISILSH